MNISNQLSKIFLFESLSQNHINLIAESCSLKSIKKGDYVFTDNQYASAFFSVISGKLKIYKLSFDGDEQILHIQQSGDLIAEAVIFEFETYPAYCQALEDSNLIRFSKPDFIKLLEKFPEISFKVMAAYSRRLRHLVSMIEELSLKDIKARLANYLIKHCEMKNREIFFILNFTKKDLAAILGTIPETLSRTLNFFKKESIISEKNNRIIILDRERLRSYIY